ncbi:hypothetical protein BELL_0084g00280 [Botrytis elliptica]|uniref:Uncharacterized protein n=1 Tax=Botrytis elliptica TaxID=278938 RepID=A0A4Z1K3C6_9HELO|nr:hypothetical protein BELL_0084g00280 [Botrytis elliptica]
MSLDITKTPSPEFSRLSCTFDHFCVEMLSPKKSIGKLIDTGNQAVLAVFNSMPENYRPHIDQLLRVY